MISLEAKRIFVRLRNKGPVYLKLGYALYIFIYGALEFALYFAKGFALGMGIGLAFNLLGITL